MLIRYPQIANGDRGRPVQWAFTIAPRGAPGPDPASSVTFLNIHASRPAAADNVFGILLIRASAYLCVVQVLWTANGCTNTNHAATPYPQRPIVPVS
jgi:hypothetical protein